jgi:pre-mRNA-processing factor 40
MKNLERLDYDEKKRIRRYHERKSREQFRELLEESFRTRMLTIKHKWNKFVALIKTEPRYLNLVGQPGSTPKELFEDFIDTEKENFRRQKGALKTIIKVSILRI